MNEAKTTTQPQPPSGGDIMSVARGFSSKGRGGAFSLGGEAGISKAVILFNSYSLFGPPAISTLAGL